MSKFTCEVVAVGTELLLGQIVDTNSSWIGEQLAIAGFDGTLHRSFGQPDMTSVVQPFADIATAAVARLLELIDGDDPAGHGDVVVRERLGGLLNSYHRTAA